MTRAPINRPGQEAGGIAPCVTGQPDSNGYYTTYTSTGEYRLMTREEAIGYIAEVVDGILVRDPSLEESARDMQLTTAIVQIMALGGTSFAHQEIIDARSTKSRDKERGATA
jgi:exosome complex RNA-binding protein Rrp42 (RNase PH superfamily)